MEYANPDALVGTEWLAAHLGDASVRVVDATWYGPGAGDARNEFENAHIPGAVHFDIDEICDHETPIVHQIPGAKQFARQVSALGLGDGHRIVVYDRSGYYVAAARVWWMFRVFGHDNVALLDGGMPKWLAEERPIEAGSPTPAPANFTTRMNPNLVRGLADMVANLESRAEQVVDARNADAFAGRESEPWGVKKDGHIPGSVHLHGVRLVDRERGGTLRPADEIAAAFAGAGVDLAKPVAISCGSGVIAGLGAFGLYLLGHENVPVFDGSWAEWGAQDETPAETGGA
ncbi:MAG: sulfurtransferase [Rhodospirillales bacterium]|jgi:thiosulfate/3-mercaptopyruvate sulfurtransferase|nr:sulfurtransferase [Rhodospirillales bacterium]MDP6803782.1 sulfurtransferase [Rhodospirillales bacterium]